MNNIILIAFFYIYALNTIFSQPALEWDTRWNGPIADDYGKLIAVDINGNVYVAGVSDSTAMKDWVVVKYNSSGDIIWSQRYNGAGNGNDEPNALKIDATGDVYVVGQSKGGNTGLDCVTIKYSPQGEQQWVRIHNPAETRDDIGFDVEIDVYKNVYVVGTYKPSNYGGNVDFGFAIKYDQNGLIKWNRNYQNTAKITAVKINNLGNVVIGGSNAYTEPLDLFELDNEDGDILYKYNSWEADIQYYAMGILNKFVLDNVGNIYTLSTAHDQGTSTPNKLYLCKFSHGQNGMAAGRWIVFNNGEIKGIDLQVDKNKNVYSVSDRYLNYHSYYVVKLSNSNELLNQFSYHSYEESNDFPVSLNLSNLNNGTDFYITGYNELGDIHMVKFDSDCTISWTQDYDCGTDGLDVAAAMFVDRCDNLYITGSSLCDESYKDIKTIKYSTIDDLEIEVSATLPICQGEEITLSVPECAGCTYLWSNSQTSDSITISPADTATFTVKVRYPSGCEVTSIPLEIPVVEKKIPNVFIIASSVNICQGEEITFTAAPLHGGEDPLFEWFVNDQLIESGTSDSFSILVLENNSVVKCVMTSNEQCLLTETDTSNIRVITVNPIIPLSVNIEASGFNICQGESVTFTATHVNGGTNPVYQWYVNDGIQEDSDSVFTSNSLSDGDKIYVVITSNAFCSDPATASSDTLIITVNGNLTPSVVIDISDNPVCAGDSAVFKAYPQFGGHSPAYKWYINDELQTQYTDIFISPPFTEDSYVYCVMTTSEECYTNISDTSNVILVEVGELLLPEVSINSSSLDICHGEEITFIATPVNGGENPVFNWFVNEELIESATSDTFLSKVLENNAIIKCIMTSDAKCLLIETDTSNEIVITVNPLLPVSLQISSDSVDICEGESVTFTATPVNGGDDPVYEWFVNDEVQEGNENKFTSNSLTNRSAIYAIVTSNALCADTVRAASDTLVITVNAYLTPSVSIISSANSICEGQNVTFTATPVNGGDDPVYQWYLNDEIQPQNTSVFSTEVFTEGANLVYCIMTSDEECLTQSEAPSNFISIAVNPLVTPTVTLIASATSVFTCQEVIFTTATSNGGFNPVFKWFINGSQVGSGPSYISSSLTNGSKIFCTMTSGANCITTSTVSSDTLTISVSPLPQPQLTLKHDTIFITNYSGSEYNYKWFFNGTEISAEPYILCSKNGNGTYYVVVSLDKCTVTSGSVDIDCSTATTEVDLENVFTIFPNPAEGLLKVEGRELSVNRLSIILYNLLGVKIDEIILTTPGREINTQFDLSGMPNGMYMISISSPTYKKVKLIQKIEGN
jgi:hypothetical protein